MALQSQDSYSRLRPLLHWAETLVITAVCLGLGAWVRPADPFYLDGGFPWPAFGPLLVGLRYGFFMALVSAVIILSGLGLHLRLSPGAETMFPLAWAVGILVLGTLAGEFRDYWERQRQQLDAANQYRHSRLEEFTRSYYLLKVSHDRLEQQLAGSSRSLREALRRLYTDIAGQPDERLNPSTANAMLQLLVRYGQIQVAGWFAVSGDQPDAEPLATIGAFQRTNRDDPLLRHALAERVMVTVQTEYRQQQTHIDSTLLAAIPFIDSENRLIGVCAIETMPFFSFEPRTLRFLAILSGHMADIITEPALTDTTGTPEQRALWRQLSRVQRDARQHDLPACLLVMTMPVTQQSRQACEHIRRIRRGLDTIAEYHTEERHQVVVLMPLTDELGLAGYQQRLEDGVREQLGIPLSEWQVRYDSVRVHQHDNAARWLQERIHDE